MLLGIALPWSAWGDLGWPALGFVAAVLLVRRLPAVLLIRPLIGPAQDVRDAALVGWLGPIGIAALFYATLAVREADARLAWTVGTLGIVGSVVVHGVTATVFTRLYGRHGGNHDERTGANPA